MEESAQRAERNETYRVGSVAAIVALLAGVGTAVVSGGLPLWMMLCFAHRKVGATYRLHMDDLA